MSGLEFFYVRETKKGMALYSRQRGRITRWYSNMMFWSWLEDSNDDFIPIKLHGKLFFLAQKKRWMLVALDLEGGKEKREKIIKKFDKNVYPLSLERVREYLVLQIEVKNKDGKRKELIIISDDDENLEALQVYLRFM